uniref:V-set and immunoglobulin domain containing 2 n=1 Tax=Crocodylus porosus TaxID=8502 RepID=A0A7M4FQE0_CROPO
MASLSWHCLSDSGPCVEVTIPTDQVMQKEGSSVELCCHYKTSVSKNFILEWSFPKQTVSFLQILYFTNNMLYKPGSQASRLSLLQSPPTTGDATIRLDNVRTSDAGTYICEVNNPPDFYGSGSGLIHFTVLMPPSTPVCKGTEYASVGSDATLTCNSAEGTPTPVYAWSHIGSKTPLPLVNMVQDEKTGTLMLTNLSQAFSGTYQCVASNEFGHASCQVTINVTGTAKAGVIVGAVIGVFLAFFLFTLTFLIDFLFYEREDATAPGITETSLQRRDSDPGNRFLERPSSQAESMSTTKSRLNIVV